MATFTFSSSKGNKPAESKPTVKKPIRIKIELKKHPQEIGVPEFYSYINSEGVEEKYSGLMTTDIDGSYIGKQIITHKVILNYHPTVESVEHKDEYFSYIDNNNRERIFIGKPLYNVDTNSYYGEVTEEFVYDEPIKIFKDE